MPSIDDTRAASLKTTLSQLASKNLGISVLVTLMQWDRRVMYGVVAKVAVDAMEHGLPMYLPNYPLTRKREQLFEELAKPAMAALYNFATTGDDSEARAIHATLVEMNRQREFTHSASAMRCEHLEASRLILGAMSKKDPDVERKQIAKGYSIAAYDNSNMPTLAIRFAKMVDTLVDSIRSGWTLSNR